MTRDAKRPDVTDLAKEIQREYAAREARRGRNRVLGVDFLTLFRKYKGNTKGIRGARSAPRKNQFLGVGFFYFLKEIQREYAAREARRGKLGF